MEVERNINDVALEKIHVMKYEDGKEPIHLSELIKIQRFYIKLKEMAGELKEFEDRHTFADEMRRSLDHIIQYLDEISHELICDIFRMKQENKDNEEFLKE